MKSATSLPKIGSLIRIINPGYDEAPVQIKCIGAVDNQERCVAVGRIALVVENHRKPWYVTKADRVPTVMIDNITGWIFNDQWEAVSS